LDEAISVYVAIRQRIPLYSAIKGRAITASGATQIIKGLNLLSKVQQWNSAARKQYRKIRKNYIKINNTWFCMNYFKAMFSATH